MTPIYHITSQTDWDDAQKTGGYRADSLDSQGFIHCSARHQVVAVANHFYRGRDGLVLLAIELDKLIPAVVWENLEGGQEQFPHIYGVLNLDAVVQVVPFPPGVDGAFDLPPSLI